MSEDDDATPFEPSSARRRSLVHIDAAFSAGVASILGAILVLALVLGPPRRLHGPTVEATRNLFAIETASRHQLGLLTPSPSGAGTAEVHQFCPSASSPVPSIVPRGVKVSTKGQWTDRTWKCLGFSMDDPHAYQFDYSATGTGSNATMTATAHGDLNGDGVVSTFVIVERGGEDGDMQRVSFSVTNEDE